MFEILSRRQTALSVALCAELAIAGPASAHHALEALYDTSMQLDTMATFVKMDWINPHVWMHFEIRYPDGHIAKNVLVETLSISGLRQIGIDKGSLTPGMSYEVTYYPNRDGSPGGYMTRMELPDGNLVGIPNYNSIGCCAGTGP